MELLGKPTVNIVTEFFLKSAELVAHDQGIGDLQIVKTPHPIGVLPIETIQERAKAIYKEVVEKFLAKKEEKESPEKVLVKPEPKTMTVMGSSNTEALHRVNDMFYRQKWTDGFPIIPPTQEALQQMLTGTKRSQNEVIGLVPPRMGKASIKNIAINAVMAGAEPAYIPVVIAAVEAVLDPAFAAGWGIEGMQSTTSTSTPLLVINGPITKELDIASGVGCLGRGYRANATIGRALRLILTNIGGSQPGVNDMKCQGNAQEFTFCVAENEDHPVFHCKEKSWKPLNVEKGFSPDTSTVTAYAAWSPNCLNLGGAAKFGAGENTGQQILYPVVDSILSVGQLPFDDDWEYVLILGSTCAQNLANAGFSKDDIKEYIYANSVMPWGKYKRSFTLMHHSWKSYINDDMTSVYICGSPKFINVVVAGGEANFSHIVKAHSTGATKPILGIMH